MPDADDFDVEELRALLRGEVPKPQPAKGGTARAPSSGAKASPASGTGSRRAGAASGAGAKKRRTR